MGAKIERLKKYKMSIFHELEPESCHDANLVIPGDSDSGGIVLMMPILSSLAAPEVVVMMTSGAAGDNYSRLLHQNGKAGIRIILVSVSRVPSVLHIFCTKKDKGPQIREV